MKDMTLDQVVESYIKIRDAKDAASAAFKKETSRMNEALSKLDALLTDKLNELGVESFKAAHGTVYIKNRSNVSVKDREEFYTWARDTGHLGAIDMKANAKAVRELLQKGIEVPGVKYSETSMIGVRRKSQ